MIALTRSPRLIAGVALALALVAVAVIGPVLTADPLALDVAGGLDVHGAPLGPSEDALLGTDALGRDVAARLVAGARSSLAIAAGGTLIALALGLIVGLAAGYAAGRTDTAMMRLVDLVLAFPALLLAILLAALLHASWLEGSAAPVAITLGLVGWTTMARVLRDKARVLARSEMVAAARALGASGVRIVLRHVLPNALGVIAVLAAVGFAQNLLAESVLSYLGLGPPPPAPSWGRMLYDGRTYYRTAPHLVIAPAVAILVAVAAFQLIASGLRDAFDRTSVGRAP